jgi:uncharacterized protein (DUF302 family)
MEKISFRIQLTDDYPQAVEKVTAALKAEGFGVLTSIDVRATMKEKLDADFRDYVILGACNPPLAHKALQVEPLVGLMLPCNVTIESTSEGALVNIMNPRELLLTNPAFADLETLIEVANEAYQRLERVAKAISSAG